MIERLVLTLLIVALLLAACKSDERQETPGGSPAPETVQAPSAETERTTVLFAVSDWQLSRYDDLIQAFEETNPDLRVQLVSIDEALGLGPQGGQWPDDTWQRLASAADVINFSTEWLDFGSTIRDLTPLIEADPTFQAEDFYPGVLESQQWDGGLWALPTIVQFDLIFFDKDAFDAAGLPYPQPGWTWDDFVAQARALTKRQGDKVTRWGFVQSWPNHLAFVRGRVGPLMDQSAAPPLPHFDQPDVIEAVRWYTDLYLQEQVTPYLPREAQEQSGIDGRQLIEAGQAAMWRDWSGNWTESKRQYNLGVVPLPVDAPDLHTSLFWTQGLSLSAGTAHPEAAWRWMNFLSRQKLEFLSSYLPARRSMTEANGFWDEIDAELATALRYAIDHSYKPPRNADYSAFYAAIDAILAGEKSVENALVEAQAQAIAQRETSQQAPTTPAPTIAVVAPVVEPTAVGAVKITFIPALASSDLNVYRDAAQQFQEAHPDVVVEIEPPNFAAYSYAMPGLAEDSDCFQWFADLQDPASRAAVLSLEPFLVDSPAFNSDDFFPATWEQFSWQGQLWAVPSEVDPFVVEYNKDLFDASDVDYPALDWSTDDFLRVAMALTQGQGESKQYGFVGQYYEGRDLLALLDRLGAELINAHEDPLALSFNDPTVVEALRWYADLSTLHGVKPVFVTDLSEDTDAVAHRKREALIDTGRAAMWTHLGRMNLVGSQRPFDVGVLPLPSRPGVASAGSWTAAIGYYISARQGPETSADTRQACWEWITFLTETLTGIQGLPARRSTAESEAYAQLVGAERAAAYQASIDGAQRPSLYQMLTESGGWAALTIYWPSRAYGQVLEGELSAEQALDAVQKLADDYRACVIARDALADQREWQKCLQETDPTLPDFLFQSGE